MAKASDPDTRTQSLVESAAEGEESVFSCVMVIDYVRPANEKKVPCNLYEHFSGLKCWQISFI